MDRFRFSPVFCQRPSACSACKATGRARQPSMPRGARFLCYPCCGKTAPGLLRGFVHSAPLPGMSAPSLTHHRNGFSSHQAATEATLGEWLLTPATADLTADLIQHKPMRAIEQRKEVLGLAVRRGSMTLTWAANLQAVRRRAVRRARGPVRGSGLVQPGGFSLACQIHERSWTYAEDRCPLGRKPSRTGIDGLFRWSALLPHRDRRRLRSSAHLRRRAGAQGPARFHMGQGQSPGQSFQWLRADWLPRVWRPVPRRSRRPTQPPIRSRDLSRVACGRRSNRRAASRTLD